MVWRTVVVVVSVGISSTVSGEFTQRGNRVSIVKLTPGVIALHKLMKLEDLITVKMPRSQRRNLRFLAAECDVSQQDALAIAVELATSVPSGELDTVRQFVDWLQAADDDAVRTFKADMQAVLKRSGKREARKAG